MSRFNTCLHGSLEDVGDTGQLTDAELRALVQNLSNRVVCLQDAHEEMRRHIEMLENDDE